MDDKCLVLISKEDALHKLCSMFFGVSCAFFAIGLLPDTKWSKFQNRSAHLLCLLVCRVQIHRKNDLVQELECVQKQVIELKKRRSEEAKANEKVMSIFSGREQTWLEERKQMQYQIDVLTNELRVVRAKTQESVSGLSQKLEECDVVLQMKDKLIEEMEQRMCANEEKLKEAENHIHTKTQRCFHVENEMIQAFREVEEAKRELDLMKGQTEQLMLLLANEILAVDLVKAQYDKEQKKNQVVVLLRAVGTLPNTTYSNLASCDDDEDAFQQLRLKDEKLEAFQWKLIRMELESRRFQSHIQRLELDIAQLRDNNLKLKTVLLEYKAERAFRERPGQRQCDPYLTDKSEKKEVSSSIITSTNIDIHSLATSYKINRLKQHLIMLPGITTENSLLSTLNKQVDIYQSLQTRIDHLDKIMQHQNTSIEVKSRRVEHFLEETFQLQRYIVATGQKLVEVQSKIGKVFTGVEEKHGSIDMKQFGDSIRGLVKEVQRGLEVQVSRIIRDQM